MIHFKQFIWMAEYSFSQLSVVVNHDSHCVTYDGCITIDQDAP